MSNYQRLQDALRSTGKSEFTRPEIQDQARSLGVNPNVILNDPNHKIRRGMYSLERHEPVTIAPAAAQPQAHLGMQSQMLLSQPKLHVEIKDLVPSKDSTFVPFGFYKDLKTIVGSNSFYPVFVTGLSGNGKTTMVEQVCASLNRECIRVNISIETDEDDLIGGNTLVDGNVVYREGPVSIAMKRGAILILDEVDRGSNKLMCLQAILEGKPYFNKKTGETIYPAPGFNIIATANTKGQGTEDGKFITAQILDDAFLERFAITVEQEYPTPSIEKKILIKKMERVDRVDEDFADKLTIWSEIIRKTYLDGGVDEVISTRRLEHVVNAFAMFGDRIKAVTLCVSRFNTETKNSFIDLYTKIDAGEEVGEPTETSEEEYESLPF